MSALSVQNLLEDRKIASLRVSDTTFSNSKHFVFPIVSTALLYCIYILYSITVYFTLSIVSTVVSKDPL